MTYPTRATIFGFRLWQTFDGWTASVEALAEDFCHDYQGNGQTPQSALGDLLAQMSKDGKVTIMAHWINPSEIGTGYSRWPEGSTPSAPQSSSERN